MTLQFGIGWRQVFASFLLLAAGSSITSAYSVMAVPLNHEFQTSRMVLMLAMTVLSGVSALLSPMLGNLLDRLSLRYMVLCGAVLLGAGYAGLSIAASFTQVLMIYAALIAPANILIGPLAATVLLSRWFVMRRGTAMGIAMAGVAAGSAIYPPVIQWLLDHHAWRDAFRLLALLLSSTTVFAALLVVNSPAERGLRADGADTDHSLAARPNTRSGTSARTILSDPAFWFAVAIFSIVLSGMKGMVTNLAPVAIDQGIEASDAALLISVYGACGFVAKLAFAAVADRVNPRALICICLGGFAGGMACLTQAASGYEAIALGVALVGLFGGVMVPLQSFLVPRIFGQQVVGRAMGLVTTGTLCALLSTPPLFGWIHDVTGSYAAIFSIFSALSLCAIVVIVPFIRLRQRSESMVPSAGADRC